VNSYIKSVLEAKRVSATYAGGIWINIILNPLVKELIREWAQRDSEKTSKLRSSNHKVILSG
jgi:hypothetical protein